MSPDTDPTTRVTATPPRDPADSTPRRPLGRTLPSRPTRTPPTTGPPARRSWPRSGVPLRRRRRRRGDRRVPRARLLIPLLAELGDDGGRRARPRGRQDPGAVDRHGRGADGRRVLPVFASVDRCRGGTRRAAGPADGVRVALAAADEGTDLVVLDPASETEFVLRRPAVWAVAQRSRTAVRVARTCARPSNARSPPNSRCSAWTSRPATPTRASPGPRTRRAPPARGGAHPRRAGRRPPAARAPVGGRRRDRHPSNRSPCDWRRPDGGAARGRRRPPETRPPGRLTAQPRSRIEARARAWKPGAPWSSRATTGGPRAAVALRRGRSMSLNAMRVHGCPASGNGRSRRGSAPTRSRIVSRRAARARRARDRGDRAARRARRAGPHGHRVPRFFGWVIGGTQPVALAADWLVSAWDQNTALSTIAPAVVAAEEIAAWLVDVLGLPDRERGRLRHRRDHGPVHMHGRGARRVVHAPGGTSRPGGIAGGPAIRSSSARRAARDVDLAGRYVGLGNADRGAERRAGPIRVDALRDTLAAETGLRSSCCRRGTSTRARSTTSRGASRRARGWSVGARRRRLRPVGGGVAAARHLVDGIDRADSWSTDAHKTLSVPYDCGIVIVRDGRPMHARAEHARELPAGRRRHRRSAREGARALAEGPGVPTWAVLRPLGRTGVAALIDRWRTRAGVIAEGVAALPGVEVLNDVVFTQVCIALEDDAATEALSERLWAEGEVLAMTSRWHDRAVVRFSVSNWGTDAAQARRTVDAVERGRSPTCARAFAEPGASADRCRWHPLEWGMAEALDAFSPRRGRGSPSPSAEPTAVQREAPGRRSRAATTPRGRADRVGQDPRRVPLGDRPAAPRVGAEVRDPSREGPPRRGGLPLAAEGARRRRRAQPPRPSSASPAPRRPSASRCPRSRSASARATRAGRAPPLVTHPPDILITTPESLFLMLTSAARETLRGVETVIVDEIHALAGTKRGPHLALARAARRAHRRARAAHRAVGDRAPARGGRAVPLRHPARSRSSRHLRASGSTSGDGARRRPRPTSPSETGSGRCGRTSRRRSSTRCSRTGRRSCSRTRAASPSGSPPGSTSSGPSARPSVPVPRVRVRRWAAAARRPPAELPGASGSPAAPSRSSRGRTTARSARRSARSSRPTSRGRLRCVVATSSLELGIDMGAVDLVMQVESPPSVASGLQRIGRAGHQVGEVSKGGVFPKHRADLLHSAVVAERMVAGAIEAMRIPANPLDVLAQQTIAAAAVDEWDVEAWFELVRRAAPSPRCRARCSTRRSTCSQGATRPTGSASCGRASSGTATPAPSSAAAVRSGSP